MAETQLKTMRRVRKYRSGGIQYKEVKSIVDAAAQSPLLESAQSLLVVIINSQTDKTILKGIADKSNTGDNLEFLMTAPYLLLVFADINSELWRENAWVALSAMSAAAMTSGFPTFPLIIPKAMEINRAFNIPPGKRFVAALPLGEPMELAPVEIKKNVWEIISRCPEATQELSEPSVPDLAADHPTVLALKKSSVFSILNAAAHFRIARMFSSRQVNKGDTILRRSEPPKAFFMIAGGTCDVIGHDGVGNEKVLTSLREGDCFGEMSILCQEPVSATIKASADAVILTMPIKEFYTVLEEYPSLNLYFTKLIALRLRKTNQKLVRETIIQGITGQLSAISLAEIVQTIDSSGRNGILHMESLHGEKGILGFRSGRILYAQCGEFKGDEAVFRFLTWPDGQFRFIQGEFLEEPNIKMDTMALLMEGYRRLDETRRFQSPP